MMRSLLPVQMRVYMFLIEDVEFNNLVKGFIMF